jgi:hypothetical protein
VVLLSCRSKLQDFLRQRPQHADAAGHAQFVVVVHEAGKVEIAGAVEGPDHGAGLAGGHVHHPGIVVLHVREFLHHGGMGLDLGLGAQHELVQFLAAVLQLEPDRLAFAHLDHRGREGHVVGHRDVDGAGHGAGLAGDAPGLLFGRKRGRALGLGVWFSCAMVKPVAASEHEAGGKGCLSVLCMLM